MPNSSINICDKESILQRDSIILSIKALVKRYPKLTRFLANYVDHFYEDYSAYKLFLKENRDKNHKINLGSGAAPVENDFKNVDELYIQPYERLEITEW